jgi:alcohol dehydrogenase
MKALVYHGPNVRALDEVPKPKIIDPTDVIVKLTMTTICGSDLHIMKGDVPTVTDGRILGHEGIGIVDEIGASVIGFKVGDKVIISCITSCGKCENCKHGMYSHCLNGGGWILGHLINGTQAEYVRIPFGDTSLYPVPAGASDEALVMLSDILPTGFEIGVLNGHVAPGDTIAIVGGGPVGLAALVTSQLYSPAKIIMIDLDPSRLEVAKKLGATHVVNSGDKDAVAQIMAITEGGVGVNVAIEAVGIAPTLELCQEIVCPGGHIANIGVHGAPVTLHMEKLWIQGITLTTGLVDTRTIPMLLKMVVSGKIDGEQLVTHHFKMDKMMEAYDTFGNAAKEKALKVIITA